MNDIKIFTSYYANVKRISMKYPNYIFISIAGKTPGYFPVDDNKYKVYKKLAPKYEWWKKWKDKNLSEEWYKNKYYETVLNKLNPTEVIQELGNNAILLCYEKSGEFCHRRIIAEWLEKNLGIKVEELNNKIQ